MTREQAVEMGRVDLPGGWYFIRDDKEGPHKGCWFLSTPDPGGCWVAKFWDGPEAGAGDVAAFITALQSAGVLRLEE